ncbi:MAG: SCO3242 family prenyltransferase, partial [Actinomycetes bacterium]
GGRRAMRVALPLAGTVWAYDLVAKTTPAGPPTMAAARALDVLLGSAGTVSPASLRASALVGAHTLGVTVVSRGEVHGAARSVPAMALAGTALVALTAGSASAPRSSALVRAGLLAAYAGTAGRPLVEAVRDPSPARLRRAVGAGILGLVPLQGALAAGAGAPRAGLAVSSALPVARLLTRRVSAT